MAFTLKWYGSAVPGLLALATAACAGFGVRESAAQRWPAELHGEWLVRAGDMAGDSAVWRLRGDGRLEIAASDAGTSVGRWWTVWASADDRRLCYTFRPGRYFVCGRYSFPQRNGQPRAATEFHLSGTTWAFELDFRRLRER